MDASRIYQQLGALLANAPDLRVVDDISQIPDTTIAWLGKVSALVEAMPGLSLEGTYLQVAIEQLIEKRGSGSSPKRIMMILSRVLAKAELLSPATISGSFVSAGDGFDAIVSLGRILSSAKSSVLIVDPYMDEKVLSDFSVLANEGVRIELLTDRAAVKPGLAPALTRWKQQYGALRPIEGRISEPKTLHDRLIFVDSDEAWILTQSLKDFAARSPATIQRADTELSNLKFESYKEIWESSAMI